MATFPNFNIPTNIATSSPTSDGVPIATFNPAAFDTFIKVLTILQDNTEILIRNNEIVQPMPKGSTFIYMNIKELLVASKMKEDLTLEFVNSKLAMSILKSIKSNNDITIFDSVEDNCYKVKTSKFIVKLPKPAKDSTAELPDISNFTQLGHSISINDSSLSDIIKNNETDKINLLIEDSQLKAIFVPNPSNDITYFLEGYENSKINNTNASVVLTSYSFLKILGEKYNVTLAKDSSRYLLVTNIQTKFEKLVIDMYEYLEDTTDQGLFI